MIDRSLAVAGIALAIIGIVVGTLFPQINRKLAWGLFVGGILLLGIAIGLIFLPDSQAQAPAINGNCNAFGNGNITCPRINTTPQPRSLSQPRFDEMRQQLLALPQNNTIVVMAAVNDGEAYNFAAEIFSFLKKNGYHLKEDRVISAIFQPPIDGQQREDEKDGTIDLKIGRAMN